MFLQSTFRPLSSISNKQKDVFNLFVKSVFVKKSITQVKPFHQILSLYLKNVQKSAYKIRKKSEPFISIIFGWLLRWLESVFANSAVKEKIKNDVARALRREDALRELTILVQEYKNSNKYSKGQLNYLRQKVTEAKSEARMRIQAIKTREKQDALAEKKQKSIRVTAVKEHFLRGGTIEDRLEKYSKKCFMKIGQARKDSEDSIKGAINTYFRTLKGQKRFTVESIVSYANAIVENNKKLFTSITDLQALKKYIEILLLGVFLRKVK